MSNQQGRQPIILQKFLRELKGNSQHQRPKFIESSSRLMQGTNEWQTFDNDPIATPNQTEQSFKSDRARMADDKDSVSSGSSSNSGSLAESQNLRQNIVRQSNNIEKSMKMKPTEKTKTLMLQTQKELKMLMGLDLGIEIKLMIVTRLLHHLSNQQTMMDLAKILILKTNEESIDIFDVMVFVCREVVKRRQTETFQHFVETFFSVFTRAVTLASELYLNFISNRVRENSLIQRLYRLTTEPIFESPWSDEECRKMNEKLSTCARNATLSGRFTNARQCFANELETSLQLPVKLPTSITPDFYAKVVLENYGENGSEDVSQILADVVDLFPTPAFGSGKYSSVGHVQIFSNGFASMSTCPIVEYEEKIGEIVDRIKKISVKPVDPGWTPTIGNMVCIPEHNKRGILLDIQKDYLVYLMDMGYPQRTSKIVPASEDLKMKPPLIKFCQVEGLAPDHSRFNDLAAQALLSVLPENKSEALFIPMIKNNQNVEEELWKMFYTEKTNLQLVALKGLLVVWRRRHDLTIQRKKNYQPDLECVKQLSHFVVKKSSSNEALHLIFFQLNILEEIDVKSIFDESDLEATLNSLLQNDGDNIIVGKLLDLLHNGNFVAKNRLRMRLLIKQDEKVNRRSFSPLKMSEPIRQRNQSHPRLPADRSTPKKLPIQITKSVRNLKMDSQILEKHFMDTHSIPIQLRQLKDLIPDRSQPVKRDTIISVNPDHDYVCLPTSPDRDILSKHIVAFLNGENVGWIFIGVKDNLVINGIIKTRKWKDDFRIDFDRVVSSINPKVSILPESCPIGYPEFHQVEDDESEDRIIIKISVKPAAAKKVKLFQCHQGAFKRVNGTTIRIQST